MKANGQVYEFKITAFIAENSMLSVHFIINRLALASKIDTLLREAVNEVVAL
jgi:hypothetical protein